MKQDHRDQDNINKTREVVLLELLPLTLNLQILADGCCGSSRGRGRPPAEATAGCSCPGHPPEAAACCGQGQPDSLRHLSLSCEEEAARPRSWSAAPRRAAPLPADRAGCLRPGEAGRAMPSTRRLPPHYHSRPLRPRPGPRAGAGGRSPPGAGGRCRPAAHPPCPLRCLPRLPSCPAPEEAAPCGQPGLPSPAARRG
jgi:hypothetical protein